MALRRRDLVSSINSFSTQIVDNIGVPASAIEKATSASSVRSTSSSGPSTTSTKITSTVKSTASSTTKSTDSASGYTKSAAASTITSSSSIAPKSTVTSSSQYPSRTAHSSTTSTSTQTTTLTSSSTPSPTSTVLATTSTASGNSISTVGLVIAVIFALLILSAIIYLLWKYLPAARRYRERAYIARSHREGLSFSEPRKSLDFTDEESTHDFVLDDPKLGLGLREFDSHAALPYRPEEPQLCRLGSDGYGDLLQRRPLASASSELEHIVNPLSTRGTRSQFSHSTLPSVLQAGPTGYIPNPYQHQYQYQDVRARQIGVAVPFIVGGSGNGNSGAGSRGEGLPPLPLPSIGHGRPFS